MPFPHTLTSAELTRVRAGNYRAETNLAYCPQTAVFQAEVATGVFSGVFASVEFDTVTVGAYTAIKEGMTVYIGVGTDTRFAYLTTRVRKAATSDTLYIGESASILQVGDIITVVDDYQLVERLWNAGTGEVDWDVSFKKDPPQIGNLQTAYIDPRKTGVGTFTFSPLGFALAYAATISSWLWDVGDGTITVGTSTTQQITATFPQGQRYIRVTVTDSNGVTNYRVMWVNVGLTNTLLNIENPPIAGSLSDGWNMSLNTWDYQGAVKLREMPENALVVVYTREIFGDGTTAAIVTNIDFIGRTRGETGHTVGDEQWSTLQTGTLECEGFGSQLNRLSSPQWAQTHSASPSAWGQVNRPTVPRFLAHLGTFASTLWTLCSPHFNIPFTYKAGTTNADATVTVTDTSVLLPGMGVSGTGIPASTTILSITDKTHFELSANATATGSPTLTFTPEHDDNAFISQSITLTETSAGAAMDRIASLINAGLDYAQSGEIEIRRHAFYLGTAKDTLATIADWDGSDILEYSLDIDYPDKIGRAFTGFEVFSTSLGKTEYITGSAPPVARGNGEGAATEDGQILTADQVLGATITESNVRTSALYAASQPVDKLEALFYDAKRSIFTPSRSRWHTFTLIALNNIMGRVYTTSQRWICDAVSYNLLLENGEVGNQATFIREPATGTAQVSSAVSPAVVTQELPDLPAISPYPGMDIAGTINYPTDDPDPEDMQPIDSYSANLGDEEAAGNYPPPGCRNFNILMNDSTGVTTPTLTNAATYTVRASGSGQIASNGWVQPFDMTTGLNGWGFNIDSDAADMGAVVPGDGIGTADNRVGAQYVRGFFLGYSIAIPNLTGISLVLDLTKGSYASGLQPSYVLYLDGGLVDSKLPAATPDGDDVILSFATGGAAVASQVAIQIVTSQQGSAVFTGSALLKTILLSGEGTNPFTSDPGAPVNADSYYYFDPSNPNVGYPYTGFGLTFDGNPPNTIPPYNTNHVYNSTITGTGAGQLVKFSDTLYSDNDATAIKVQICGAGL